jgi:hypothetical protein
MNTLLFSIFKWNSKSSGAPRRRACLGFLSSQGALQRNRSGINLMQIEDHDLVTALQQPNARRICANFEKSISDLRH